MSNVDCGECPHISDGCNEFCEKIKISVPRWDANWHMEEFYESRHGSYVRVADFYVAQSELAALREELASAKRNEHNSEVAYKAAIEKQEELREERDSFQRVGIATMEQLKAAEQRNVELERAIFTALDDSCEGPGAAEVTIMRLDYDALCGLITKPTESGASDKCASDGGTCGLGGHCGECPHVESGASE